MRRPGPARGAAGLPAGARHGRPMDVTGIHIRLDTATATTAQPPGRRTYSSTDLDPQRFEAQRIGFNSMSLDVQTHRKALS